MLISAAKLEVKDSGNPSSFPGIAAAASKESLETAAFRLAYH